MYKALLRFADFQDGNRIYEAGEEYPRPGFAVTAERIAELAGSDNLAGKPLIKAAEMLSKAPQDKPEEVSAQSVEAPKRAVRSRKKG